MKINDFIDQVIPIDKVKMDVVLFLIGCKYQLEIDESFIILPKNIDLRVQTRAYIKADTPDIFIDDHFEAVVMLGCIETENNWRAKYGYLKFYYDLSGQFITEDRYPIYGR